MISEMMLVLAWAILTFSIASGGALAARAKRPDILVGIFVALMMMVPAFGSKPTLFGPFTVNAPIIVFSAGFLITDMLSEFFGKAAARRAVFAGFFGTLIFAVTSRIALAWPHPEFWENQKAFVTVFDSSWRIVLASFVAYLAAQLHDVWAFHFWKEKFQGRHLWLRNNLSTCVSQIIDSAIFLAIAFYGVLPISQMFVSFVVFKFILAAIDTPFLYLVRWFVRRERGEFEPAAATAG